MRGYGILDLIERYERYVYLKQSSKRSGIFLDDIKKAFSVREEGPKDLPWCGRAEIVLSISEYVGVEAFMLRVFFHLFEVSEELLERSLGIIHGCLWGLACFYSISRDGSFLG